MRKIFLIYLTIALIVLTGVVILFDTSLPLFTYIWLVVPLILLIKNKPKLGIDKIAFDKLIKYSIIHFVLIGLIYLSLEPWSQTYKLLLDLAVQSQPPDPTFIWLESFSGLISYLLIFLVSLFITIFGEELFFRGLLLQIFKKKLNSSWAIVIQAALFTVPNLIAAFFMPLTQAVIYIFGYAFLAVGCVGGYTAAKTNSIWPSLISASTMNLIMVLIYY